MFRDRAEAGEQLAQKLAEYQNTEAIVLALPRGGVVVGQKIAESLGLPLDIVVTRKIGHPSNPEYAICAVDAHGTLLCDERERARVSEAWLTEAVERERREAARRSALYRGSKPARQIKGKTVIITDDGVATGLTIRLAIQAVKAEQPEKIVVAVPVAPSDTAQKIRREADTLIVLEPPEDFLGAVGAHYAHFLQVEDAEVIRLLALV
jgi:putative phosphoribosyl transferase